MTIGTDPEESHRELELPEGAMLEMYRLMVLARRVDDRLWALQAEGTVPFAVAAAGREAVQVGAAFALDAEEDWVVPHYRDLALMVALGLAPAELFLSFFGKAGDPAAGGCPLPGHWSLPGRRVLSRSPAPATGFPHAAGIAYELRRRGRPGVVLATGGEEALAQGGLHEALDFAALHGLPVIFLLEIDRPGARPTPRQAAGDPAERARAYDMAGVTIDGNDVFAVYREVSWAAERARAGEGPTFIEALIYPYYAQTAGGPDDGSRTPEEVGEWQRQDPVGRLRYYLVERRLLTEADEERFDQESAALVAAAVAAAEQAPDSGETLGPVYARPVAAADPAEVPARPPAGQETNLITAVSRALHDLLTEYPQTLVLREGRTGPGAPGEEATADLGQAFGPDRCFEAPAAGSSIVGVAIGLAAAGAQPIVEIRSADLVHSAFHQIAFEAARLHYRSGGGWSCPLVVRLPYGGGPPGGLHPGRPGEGRYAHVPGLKVVVPSTPADAAGLLRAAVEDPDPVVFLEPRRLYRSARGPVPEGPYRVPLGRAALRRPGRDLTIITYGAAAHDALEAAGRLAERGIEAEVLDLRTLRPLDWASVEAAVRRTGKLLIVYEDNQFAGFGAEVSAQIGERAFEWLDAPVRRYAAAEVPDFPSGPAQETRLLPSVEGIVERAVDLAEF